MEPIKTKLKSLRLSGASQTLAERHRHAQDNGLSYLEFLELLLEDELARREAASYERRLKQSKLSSQKRLEDYDFTRQPDIDRRLVSELATCRFIPQRENVILMGKPGVGKTHLATALGLKAIEAGYKVLFIHANELIGLLRRSRADESYPKTLKKLIKYDLLIIDELGFKTFPASGADDFFEVVRRRYEEGAIILTTNRDFTGWEGILGDAVLASAIIDRLVHHGHIIKILGKSYRLQELQKNSSN